MKVCTVCKEEKPLGDFYNRKASIDGKGYRCKPCDDVARFAYREKHKDKQRLMARKRQLRFKYNLEIEEYERMLEEQNGKCAICNGDPVRTSNNNQDLVVDHCHISGKIRGLLCQKCNKALGLLNDSVSTLKKAIEYLKN